MHRLFQPLDEEVSCRLTESGKMVLDIAHLIERKHVERYQNKFASTSAMMRECQMQISGPWPPYHFVHRLTRAHGQPAPAAPADDPYPGDDGIRPSAGHGVAIAGRDECEMRRFASINKKLPVDFGSFFLPC